MIAKRLTLFAVLVLSLATLTLGACGGTAPAIKHRMSMDVLAQTPPEDRGPVAEAYRAHYQAQLELAHIEFQLRDIEYELKIARAEKAQRKHAQRVAELEGKRSAAAFMTDLASSADKLLNGMKKERRAQGERIRYLKAQRSYLHKARAHAKLALVHAEAAFELSKAKLAKERDTVPKNFQIAKFVTQEKNARAKSQKKAQSAKSAKAKASAKEKAWKNAGK